jgi:hypothetical protein
MRRHRQTETLWGSLVSCCRLSIGPPAGGGKQPPRRLSTCPTFAVLTLCALFSASLGAQEVKDTFRIKYVAEGAVYIEGGRAAGIAEKMRLTVSQGADVTIELEVVSVADSSAVCEIRSPGAPPKPGDYAKLSSEDAQKSQILQKLGSGNHYAQTITFTGGDPVDEEAREYVPRPPLPEVNRFRGRIGFEYSGIIDQGGSGATSSQVGLVLRADMTRIGGSYWNLNGYTRIQLSSVSNAASQTTLNDLLNRTYHVSLTYNNPQSKWIVGFGRMYLPWAPSLSTIDGGYLARRVAKAVTLGMFAGTTPDPTSWNYSPNRQEAGAFLNFEGGSWDGFKYSSTTGFGVSRLSWHPESEFVFFENTFSWKRYFSVYHSLQADRSHATPVQPTAAGTGVARSFLTIRFEPAKVVSFDLNDNYFRSFPTFDPRLVGTGLLDKFLFQGLSGGAHLNLPYRSSFYVTLGKSSGTGDPSGSWNQLYGFAMNDILHSGIRADAHYSHFDSSFGKGDYQSVSLSRDLRESLRLSVQAGQQNFVSQLTNQTRARFANGSLDWNFAAHYFLSGGVTVYRGQTQNYDQVFFTLGYRFSK